MFSVTVSLTYDKVRSCSGLLAYCPVEIRLITKTGPDVKARK